MSIYNLRPYIGNFPLIGGYNLGPYIGGEGGVITRNFTTLDPALSMHYTIPAVTLTGSFQIELDFIYTSGNQERLITGGDVDVIRANNGSQFLIKLSNVSYIKNTPSFDDGKLHRIKVTRDASNNIEGFLDGVSFFTDTQTGNVSFTDLGRRESSNSEYWDGILADVKITDAGILRRNYALDEENLGTAPVIIDTGTDGLNGTAVNIADSDSENFTFDGSVSPNTWTNDGDTITIEVAGT